MRGTFIALEGPDGVGKTTLAQQLAQTDYEQTIAAPAHPPPEPGAGPLVFVARRQISATSTYSAHLMRQLSTMLWHSGDAPDLPDAFWVTLQASWYTAHTSTVLEPLLASGHDVLVDGWAYKFFSKLLLQGYSHSQLDTIFARVPMPDAVVLLSADPSQIYDHRDDFRPAELGMHAGYTELNRDTFIDYQQAGLKILYTFAEQHGWPIVQAHLGEPVEDSAARIAPIISRLRALHTSSNGKVAS